MKINDDTAFIQKGQGGGRFFGDRENRTSYTVTNHNINTGVKPSGFQGKPISPPQCIAFSCMLNISVLCLPVQVVWGSPIQEGTTLCPSMVCIL